MAGLAYCSGGIRPNVTPPSAATSTPPCNMALDAAQRDPALSYQSSSTFRQRDSREPHIPYPLNRSRFPLPSKGVLLAKAIAMVCRGGRPDQLQEPSLEDTCAAYGRTLGVCKDMGEECTKLR
ncbi:hypothetical protein CMUS01_01528 [Colletotrichum musicola]|uniref:Uncharacterized protein n=1 Tax=Colletotrichum musicola TaxID=2175873 RepID=A0A8H6NX27_9PEZI|nr:hypothetical protein CMUS01_01528 [Colletotrichum musicola]